AYLITRVGFLPDGTTAWFFVQDRAQTWLDFCTVPLTGGTPRRLFRETTGAWVRNRGTPEFLADGSFLLLRRCGVFAVVVRAHRPVRTMTASDETDDSQYRDTDSSPVLHRSFSPFRRIFEIDSVS
ncbi:MAG: DPP IV N-terminal domain-containing protein, partial [Planctomycetes bacterium]|nr:DPP IV N-terminal domain-containing protein [Planctomycetota bacterium]